MEQKGRRDVQYFHIAFNSPLGIGTFFYRGEEHPLMPAPYEARKAKLASSFSIKSGGFVHPDAITYLSLTELPKEVAKARWPEDFKEK